MTIRQEIREILERETISAQDIANLFRTNLKEILEHLEHIKRIIKKEKKELIMYPAGCKTCGFIFKERSKIKSPSKCPSCKSEFIEKAKLHIREIKNR